MGTLPREEPTSSPQSCSQQNHCQCLCKILADSVELLGWVGVATRKTIVGMDMMLNVVGIVLGFASIASCLVLVKEAMEPRLDESELEFYQGP